MKTRRTIAVLFLVAAMVAAVLMARPMRAQAPFEAQGKQEAAAGSEIVRTISQGAPVGARTPGPIGRSAFPKPAARRSLFAELPRFDWKNATLTAADVTFTNLDIRITRESLRKIPGSGEADPLWRPFIHSPAAYAVGAAENAGAKLLGDWMRRSPHKWVRRFWWAPQAADATAHAIGWAQWKSVQAQQRCWERTHSQGCF